MFFIGKEFIKPTKKLRMLAILQALSENSRLSQSRLGKFSHTSSAMVHQYLSDMQKTGQLVFQPVDKKSFMYSLTEKGSSDRRDMMEEYCTEMVQAYASIKRLIKRRLEPLTERGLKRVALFGAAETCELVLTALEGSGFEIAGILDNAPQKQGKTFRNHTILAPAALADLDVEAIVITSFAQQDDIFNQLVSMPSAADREIIRL
ncbi:winged helix-turn-helix transcriptional regulator [Desulfovibrio mangrovi]|uniref:winged helix-turn-helix transcriptional regulator n=1 Tax=Desulfovibrio mangrovi TaxID=2976983 RepID=UPI0022485E1E|nr:winged helix-turn-helix transcriptional regulator [Desulfovibrio mangrovi]UZP66147.1 winged helix-turn-helix transcriptional regulator [Desulfovibrio mangrovi]